MARFAKSKERRAAYAELRDVEPFTRCGTRIQVMMNAGLRDDLTTLSMVGADGIGLFRTEFQFLVSATLPQREKRRVRALVGRPAQVHARAGDDVADADDVKLLAETTWGEAALARISRLRACWRAPWASTPRA